MIYFIRSGEYVKIGRAVDIEVRMAQLQTAHPVPLVLIATMEGGVDVEKALHFRFESKRTSGEWFRLTDSEVQGAIETFMTTRVDSIERALNLENWLSIVTFDVFKYAKAGGAVQIEWSDDGLTLRLVGITPDTEGLNTKFRRHMMMAATPAPSQEPTP